MAETIEMKEKMEQLIMVGVQANRQEDVEQSLLELKELIRTAGAQVIGTIVQNRESVHPGTYIGKGKIDEVQEMILSTGADGIVCDDELSPAQMRNLEDALGCKVLDRTMVILDIFAARASTNEGKIQVEMAQLKYRSTRLSGFGTSMSRLGGGIGTRGPGEKKIETDRRLIRDRVSQLGKELEEVVRHRDITRQQRAKNHATVAAIVGYTNAGKSTLLNLLTKANVLSEDKLFATLDPTTRELTLPSGGKMLMTDTVGFIRKLPHHLVDAFKSTLEEARYSDMIIHVVDASNPDMDRQMEVVYDTLQDLEVGDKPIVTLFNKCDKPEAQERKSELRDFKADKTLYISAKQGEGIDTFLKTLDDMLREQKVYLEHCFGFQEAGKIQLIRRKGQLLSEEYTQEGIEVKAYVPKEVLGQVIDLPKEENEW